MCKTTNKNKRLLLKWKKYYDYFQMIWSQDNKLKTRSTYFKMIKYKINIKTLRTFLHTMLEIIDNYGKWDSLQKYIENIFE